MTPNVTPWVWFTLSPRRSKWCEASAGAVVTRVLRASLASVLGAGVGTAGAMLVDTANVSESGGNAGDGEHEVVLIVKTEV
jgi:hypothetical protein